jgi:regulator of RNase E activity RraA
MKNARSIEHRHRFPVAVINCAATGCAAPNACANAIIVDGVVTDIVELSAMGMPVFARGTSLLTAKHLDAHGNLLIETVTCGGLTVNPGDIVVADDNGILFMNDDTAVAVIDQALASGRAEQLSSPGCTQAKRRARDGLSIAEG